MFYSSIQSIEAVFEILDLVLHKPFTSLSIQPVHIQLTFLLNFLNKFDLLKNEKLSFPLMILIQ